MVYLNKNTHFNTSMTFGLCFDVCWTIELLSRHAPWKWKPHFHWKWWQFWAFNDSHMFGFKAWWVTHIEVLFSPISHSLMGKPIPWYPMLPWWSLPLPSFYPYHIEVLFAPISHHLWVSLSHDIPCFLGDHYLCHHFTPIILRSFFLLFLITYG